MRGVAAAEESVEGCGVGSVGAQRMELLVVVDCLGQDFEMDRGFNKTIDDSGGDCASFSPQLA